MKNTKIFLFVILFFVLFHLMNQSQLFGEEDVKKNALHASIKENLRILDKHEMLVSFLPIQEGEATLIQLEEQFYLIDTGSYRSSEQLLTLLDEHGVKDLKAIILTNPCDEHIGGLQSLVSRYTIDSIYLPEIISSVFKIPYNKGIATKKLRIGDEIKLNKHVKLFTLAPSEPLSLSPQNNSLVFQLIHGDIQILFTSDINREIEERLTKRFQLKSEILKVSDYGSDLGSSPDFLEEIDPHVGVIFSNNPKLYKMSDDVVERLHETWVDVYMVRRHGEIQIMSDGKNYQVETLNNEDDRDKP